MLFVPIAWLMGVDPEECQTVGSLIGIKTMANEFIAYKQLGKLKTEGKISVCFVFYILLLCHTFLETKDHSFIFFKGRSEAIATFALCAFSNPGALGSSIATLSALEKRQTDKIHKVAIRAFFAGCITTFTSASIAGI